MTACEIEEVADWLIDGARSAPQPVQVLAQLSERLVACGIPLWRVAVFVRTLHPRVMGRRFIWRPGTGVEVSEAPFELLESADSAWRNRGYETIGHETGRAIGREQLRERSLLDQNVDSKGRRIYEERIASLPRPDIVWGHRRTRDRAPAT